MWQYNYSYSDPNNDFLMHYKYIDKKMVNGKWRYTYPSDKNTVKGAISDMQKTAKRKYKKAVFERKVEKGKKKVQQFIKSAKKEVKSIKRDVKFRYETYKIKKKVNKGKKWLSKKLGI